MQVVDESMEIQLLDCPEVPSNKENFDDIFRRLQRVEEALQLRPAVEATKGFLASKWEWAINHKGTSVILGIVFCLVSVFGGAYFKYYLDHKDDGFNAAVDKRIRLELEKPDGVLKTLQNIQQTVNRTEAKLGTLEPFIHDVIQRQFESASKLPTATIQERLPAIKDLFAVARDQRVDVDPKIVAAMRDKLMRIQPQSTSFWPTVTEFISYRSQIDSPNTQSLRDRDLPTCTNSNPFPMRVADVDSKGGIKRLDNAYYQDCRLTLDWQQDVERLNSQILKWKIIEFHHCLIVYKGGDFTLITGIKLSNAPLQALTGKGKGAAIDYSGPTLRFKDCLFDFSVPTRVPDRWKAITQSLLAQTGPSFTLPVERPS